MNAAAKHHDELSDLAPYVDEVLEESASTDQQDEAQQRLMARIAEHRLRQARPAPRTRMAWTAAAAIVITLGASLATLMTDNGSGTAFAAVQQRFQDFKTLEIDMSVGAGGQLMPVTSILLDDQGHMRMDYGDRLSYVLDPERGILLQLLHPAKRAVRMHITPGTGNDPKQSLEWLEDLRKFKGKARQVPGEHDIDGVPVTGYQLNAGGQDMVLWATRDGEPVRLEMRQGAEGDPRTAIQMDFRFDRPLDAGAFSLEPPAGYQVSEAGPDAD